MTFCQIIVISTPGQPKHQCQRNFNGYHQHSIGRSRYLTNIRCVDLALLNFDTLVAFLLVIVIWSFWTSAAFYIETFITCPAPYGESVKKQSSRIFRAHFFGTLSIYQGMPWNRIEFNDGGVGRAGEMCCWMNEGSPAVGEEWRWQHEILIDRIIADST